MGWTKPGFLEKEGDAGAGQDHDGDVVPLPRAAKSGGGAVTASAMPSLGKAVVLRGEDFPSLQAALPATTGSTQKQKDGIKGKNAVSGLSTSPEERVEKSSPLHMRPQTHLPRLASDDGLNESGGVNRGASGGLNTSEPTRKQDELFLGPLPLVRLSHRSDWADDERDTGSNSLNRDRDSKAIRLDADFDVTKPRYPNSYGYNFSGVKLMAKMGRLCCKLIPLGRMLGFPAEKIEMETLGGLQ